VIRKIIVLWAQKHSYGYFVASEILFRLRAYIAIRGGIDVPVIMGSRSTNLKCKLGGLDGRPLKAGDIVPSAFCSGKCQRFILLYKYGRIHFNWYTVKLRRHIGTRNRNVI